MSAHEPVPDSGQPPSAPPTDAAGAPVRSVRTPRQARSRRTLERIERAALAILDEAGPDGLTVQAVVARAGSSVGSFYARFTGKEELLEYLGERVWDEARGRWDAALADREWAGLALPELVEGSVRLLLDTHGPRASHLRALDRAGGRDGFAAFRAHVLEGLSDLMLARGAEIMHPEPEVAVRFGLAAVNGIAEAVGPASERPFSADVVVREGRALLMAYLGGASGEPPENHDVDFFDAWG